jgi:hypothetical protein
VKKQIKIWSILLLVVLASSYVGAIQKPVPQQAGTMHQMVIGAQDVITASDAGGGFLSSRDMLLIVLICAIVLVVVLVL